MTTCLLVIGCSNDTARDSQKKGVSISEICDSAIQEGVKAELAKITGSASFKEMRMPSLKEAAGKLNAAGESQSVQVCRVYNPADGSGAPALEIEFERREAPPKSRDDSHGTENDLLVFPISKAAHSMRNESYNYTSADIYFSCPRSTEPRNQEIIHGSSFIPAQESRSPDLRTSAMSVLNSVARSLARELDCRDSADLPQKIPAPVSQ